MVKCVFCGRDEHAFKGIHLIKNDGSVDFFCSSKCRKNSLKLKRDRKKFKWTEAFHEQRQKMADKHVRDANAAVERKKAEEDKAKASEEKSAKKSKKQ